MPPNSPFRPRPPQEHFKPQHPDEVHQAAPTVSPNQPELGQQLANYDFIMNANQRPGPMRSNPLPGSQSMLVRVGVVGAGLILLIIAFSIVKGIVGGGSITPALLSIAQDQQELIHLATNATQQTDLTTTNQNFSATVQLSVASEQSQLLTYMSTNKMKYKKAALELKISTATDTQLTTAAAATTYNETYAEIMQQQLNTYSGHLKTAYDQAKGAKIRALLSSEYDQATLLFNQLNTKS